jgi:hypothetical protein
MANFPDEQMIIMNMATSKAAEDVTKIANLRTGFKGLKIKREASSAS